MQAARKSNEIRNSPFDKLRELKCMMDPIGPADLQDDDLRDVVRGRFPPSRE